MPQATYEVPSGIEDYSKVYIYAPNFFQLAKHSVDDVVWKFIRPQNIDQYIVINV